MVPRGVCEAGRLELGVGGQRPQYRPKPARIKQEGVRVGIRIACLTVGTALGVQSGMLWAVFRFVDL